MCAFSPHFHQSLSWFIAFSPALEWLKRKVECRCLIQQQMCPHKVFIDVYEVRRKRLIYRLIFCSSFLLKVKSLFSYFWENLAFASKVMKMSRWITVWIKVINHFAAVFFLFFFLSLPCTGRFYSAGSATPWFNLPFHLRDTFCFASHTASWSHCVCAAFGPGHPWLLDSRL